LVSKIEIIDNTKEKEKKVIESRCEKEKEGGNNVIVRVEKDKR